jgi:hypothetical protein
MAKRARGSTRPGQRRPIQRSAARPSAPAPVVPASPRSSSLTPEEEARAAELEAKIVADERAAEDARKRTTDRRRTSVAPDLTPGPRTGGSLAVRAADEYAYVGRDVRRITLIGGALIILMLAIWVITQLTGSAAI